MSQELGFIRLGVVDRGTKKDLVKMILLALTLISTIAAKGRLNVFDTSVPTINSGNMWGVSWMHMKECCTMFLEKSWL